MLVMLSRGMFDLKDYLARNRGLALKLARELGITHGAISQWREVPPLRVIDVERITGISRHELRPDMFGPKSDNARKVGAA